MFTIDQITNKLFCGDCLEIMKEIPSESIDLILCDLPYGTTACKWDELIPQTLMWKEYKRIVKNVSSIVLFSSGQFTPYLMASNLEMFKYKYVWLKCNTTNFVHAKNRPMTEHEDVLVFSKAPMGHFSQLGDKRMTYNPQGLTEINEIIKLGKGRFGTIAGERPSHRKEFIRTHTGYPTDVLTGFPEPPTNQKLHTSEKSIPLLEYLIKTYTNEGNLVLDNCAGSGTTGIACKNTNRKFCLIEKEEKYCEIIKKRLQNNE